MSLRYEEKRFYKLLLNVVRKFIDPFVTIVIVFKQRTSDILFRRMSLNFFLVS